MTGSFGSLAEYRRSRLTEGDDLEVEYVSKKASKPSGPTQVIGEVTQIDDHGDDVLVWLEPRYRKTRHTVSIVRDNCNLHAIYPGLDVRTLSEPTEPVTCRVQRESR